jgi:hypothetical protein
MSKVRLIMLAALAALVVSGAVADASSAAAKLKWKVAGAELAAGKTKTFTSKATKNYMLEGKALGVEVKIGCEVQASTGNIEGGDGVGESGDASGTMEFSKCNVLAPTKCALSEPITGEVEAELVEDSAHTGEVLVLFHASADAAVFVKIKFTNKGTETCVIKNQETAVEGNFAAKFTPKAGEEALAGKLIFPSSMVTKVQTESEGKRGAAQEEAVELKLGGNKATFTGESEVKLSPAELFGVI